MRVTRSLLTVVLALSPLTAVTAQQRPPVVAPRAAPPLTLSAAQRATLNAAAVRGRQLAALDAAGRVTTRDMLVRLADPAAAGIVGWVAVPEGNGMTVSYYARGEGDGYVAVYRAQALGGRATAAQVFPADGRPPLTGPAARMAAARAVVDALDHRPCTGTAFNTLVVPPAGADDPIAVYEINPRRAANRVPVGGHRRTLVNADGSVGETATLGGECAEIALPPAGGARPRPLVLNARTAVLPDELAVFLSLWTGRNVVVATGTDRMRLWGVTGTGIGELRQ